MGRLVLSNYTAKIATLQKCRHSSGLPCSQSPAPIAAAFDSWYPMHNIELADTRGDAVIKVP